MGWGWNYFRFQRFGIQEVANQAKWWENVLLWQHEWVGDKHSIFSFSSRWRRGLYYFSFWWISSFLGKERETRKWNWQWCMLTPVNTIKITPNTQLTAEITDVLCKLNRNELQESRYTGLASHSRATPGIQDFKAMAGLRCVPMVVVTHVCGLDIGCGRVFPVLISHTIVLRFYIPAPAAARNEMSDIFG